MTRDELRAALAHPNVQAFLRVIREGETNQTGAAYKMLFGGGYFSSFVDHPRRAVSAAGLTSTAAGAYQFLSKTWDGLEAKYGFPDFSPACQDEAAVALIHGRQALADLLRGDLSEVLDKCSYEWASLPPGRYGQPTLDAKRVYAVYEKWLAPAQSVPAPVPEKPAMPAPFVFAAFEALLAAVPTLIRSFGKGQRSEDNAKLAEMIVPIAKQAVGATNEQDLVEKLADPALVNQIDKAVRENWLDIQEAGGGGIQGAREYNLQAADKPLRQQPAFIISLLLLIFPLLLCFDVFVGHPGFYTPEMKTQVITAILVIIGMVGAFWLGSSQSSRTKDEALVRSVK